MAARSHVRARPGAAPCGELVNHVFVVAMRNKLIAILVALAMAATLSVPASPASASGRTLQDANTWMVSASYRPHRIWYSADTTWLMTNVRWSKWTSTEAVGHGWDHMNNCVPDCASGTWHRVWARLI